MSEESISQPVAASADARVPDKAPPSRRAPARTTVVGDVSDPMLEESALAIESPVPDWCNLGLVLRVVVAINALFFCIAALHAATVTVWLDQWLRLAMSVEPVLIASLLFGCLIRRATWRLPTAMQFAIALLLPAALTVVAARMLDAAAPDDAVMMARDAAFAALLAASVLYWARLRGRAYSPALAEAQLQALQARIRPHFLFNSLNAALALIRSDPRRAETVLEDIAELFRALMRDNRERVPLASEVALCERYLAIEQLRLGERLSVTWNVEERALGALVPALLLQPLIENAVHHGIEPSVTAGTVDIDIRLSGRQVDIVVANPWLGSASGEATRGNRIGLDNVRQRLALVHDLEATLDSSVRGGRYIVHIRLPAERRRTEPA